MSSPPSPDAAMGGKLSALITVHNEEAQLGDCLDTLSFADEIVVVLDDCTDGSKDITARFTARLIEGAWDIEGERRNDGIAACSGDWIFEIDADERVPQALAREIAETIATSRHDWHPIPVDNYIGGRLVRHGWGAYMGRSAYAGLFRKGAKSWGPERVHPSLSLSARRGPRLENRLEHYVYRDISDLIDRFDRYTTLRASDLRASGDIGSLAANVRRIFSRFFKCYVSRKGHREGAYGLLIALFAGLYPIVSYLKARIEEE
jgi:glycosyltransferase involved in cell wall biosynthesis